MASSVLHPTACPFDDCLYRVRLVAQAGEVFCSHQDKGRFFGSQSCPLYQCDWIKKMEGLRK